MGNRGILTGLVLLLIVGLLVGACAQAPPTTTPATTTEPASTTTAPPATTPRPATTAEPASATTTPMTTTEPASTPLTPAATAKQAPVSTAVPKPSQRPAPSTSVTEETRKSFDARRMEFQKLMSESGPYGAEAKPFGDKAREAAQRGDFEEAIRLYDAGIAILKKTPTSPTSPQSKPVTEEVKKAFDARVIEAQKQLNYGPGPARVALPLVEKAREAGQRGNFEEAIRLFDEAITILKTYPTPVLEYLIPPVQPPANPLLWKFAWRDTYAKEGQATIAGADYHTMTYPAVSHDEATIYFGNFMHILTTPFDNNALYALDTATGKVTWKYELGSVQVKDAASIAPDGTIYFVGVSRPKALLNRDKADASLYARTDLSQQLERLGFYNADAWLYALTPQGTLKWRSPLLADSPIPTGKARAIPAIAHDGAIYVGANGLYAFNPNGSLKWEIPTYSPSWNAPVIGADGTIYAADVKVRAVTPDGREKWSVALPVSKNVHQSADDSPSIGTDGTFYVITEVGALLALRPDGTEKWRFDAAAGVERAIKAGPAIAQDGTLYFGTKVWGESPNVRFFALNPDGTIRWTFDPPQGLYGPGVDIYYTPLIGADGTIYFGGEFGTFYALTPDGKVKWRYGPTWETNRPVLLKNGTLIVSDVFQAQHALRTDSQGLSKSPWPKFRFDNQNTGRVSRNQGHE